MNKLDGRTLVERYYGSLYRFALSLARSEPVAADLTQETFYLWASKGHQLRDPAKAKSWLFTTLHREFLRRERHSTRFPHHEASQVEHELPMIAASFVDSLDCSAAMEALQRVDEHYRVPLAMFYLEDFSYKEIAAALDLPVGTIMSRLSRGKAQMRRFLGEATLAKDGKLVPFPSARRQAGNQL